MTTGPPAHDIRQELNAAKAKVSALEASAAILEQRLHSSEQKRGLLSEKLSGAVSSQREVHARPSHAFVRMQPPTRAGTQQPLLSASHGRQLIMRLHRV